MQKSRITALVVDDERINTLILEKMLSCFGIEAVCVSNGNDCLDVCSRRGFDYVFLDIRMPGLSGFDIIEQLNSIFKARGRDVPVICITGMTGRNETEEILDAGFREIMTKPINRDVLREVLFRYEPAGKKIIEDFDEDEAEEHLPEIIKSIPGLDTEYGVSHCGSVSDFLQALKIFGSSIDDKASAMDEYIKRGYIEDIKMVAHSLKSTSVAVGAKQLSEMAKLLEKACSDHNIPLVYSLTPEFLTKYREMGDALKEVWDGGKGGGELKTISEAQLMEALETAEELIASYDRRNVDILLESLKSYNLPPEWKSFFDRLKEHIRKMDWESARDLINEFRRG